MKKIVAMEDKQQENDYKNANNPTGGFRLKNPRITHDTEDILYHLAMGNKSHDLVEVFSDVKFVVMGGTAERMEKFAYYIKEKIGYKLCPGTMLQNLSEKSHRYAMYKVGPVISVSHGMGMPSLSILLHEMLKLMFHAGVKNPIFIRLGTSGGVAQEAGSVVITSQALNGTLKPFYRWDILGEPVERPSVLCTELGDAILEASHHMFDFSIIKGKTISTDDFYEGQGRLDGAFCEHSDEDKFQFLRKVSEQGVKNFEMEVVALSAITHFVGVHSACVCVTFLDRLNGDQIQMSKEKLAELQERPMFVVGEFINKFIRERGKNVKCDYCSSSVPEISNCGCGYKGKESNKGWQDEHPKVVIDRQNSLDQVLVESEIIE